RTFWHIALPLAIPAFVVVLIWQFTNAWNDFLFAVFFSSPANGPVTLALNNLANGALLANYGVSMAGALLASLPTLVVYIVLSKYFLAGLMQGSVKGGAGAGPGGSGLPHRRPSSPRQLSTAPPPPRPDTFPPPSAASGPL